MKLIKVTKDALYAGIKLVGDGNKLGTIAYAIQQHAENEGYGVVRELVGHGLGTTMHEGPEVPNYGKRGRGKKFQEGMVLAIEPMINMGSAQTKVDDDEWTVRTFDGSNSAHFEHTIGIMDNEIRVFTENLF